MTTAQVLRARLDADQARLMRALSGVTEEQFKRRPQAAAGDPAPWCIAEVLGHLLSNEKLWVQRIALALEGDGREISPSPPEAHEDNARSGRHVPVPLLVHGLLGARYETETLLAQSTLPDGALRPNSVWHPRLGERLDLAWMFEKIAGHFEEHFSQIDDLRISAGAAPLAESASA